ncbi:uncharacterized protein ACOB8E_006322 isoform 1-T1 [Sarcophilus harrisii]
MSSIASIFHRALNAWCCRHSLFIKTVQTDFPKTHIPLAMRSSGPRSIAASTILGSSREPGIFKLESSSLGFQSPLPYCRRTLLGADKGWPAAAILLHRLDTPAAILYCPTERTVTGSRHRLLKTLLSSPRHTQGPYSDGIHQQEGCGALSTSVPKRGGHSHTHGDLNPVSCPGGRRVTNIISIAQ